ncbi:carbohydrate ABC transporter substrate-binding protein (CUT1 family) [Thermolongibacillus altinsuensis]|uniref:Carbohydrate ABC transporter substrate-binding protein (CUT1 family) n=1 Tax=Thermolongibacillus altinsuensis TaxID=575256 RepID=A0A4R1QNJ8_9BACL|nr:ABC transporter substrate-binding protein [Thermolongibacillus altinsuensis]TCL51109.1 carbohydrate ABC transporter substrate-binding protein (CUT1 family) [Thermolongibacillus altinsuensis]GMB08823.1 putative ABC transporter-binding protein [Thermolongibacillus altinsuensis]
MKKVTKVSSALLALTLGLTACSQGDAEPAKKETGEKDTAKKSEEVVKIVYARGQDATKATEKIIEEFEKKHPNIDVELREMPSDTGAQHDAYVTMLNAQSSEIDVMDLDVVWPAEFAQAGYVLPLDRFIEKDGIDLSTYNQGALAAGNFGGKQWAMPKFIDAGLLFYRTDIVPKDKVPKTWDELLAAAREFKGKGGTKFGYLMQAKQYEGLVCNAVEFIASYGGKIVDENNNVVINSPEAIKGLKKMVEIVKSDVVPSNITTFTEPESHTAFIEGQAPFIRNWPYQYALANDKEQSKIVGKVGVAPLPAGDAGSAATLGGWMTAINKYSKHKEEAWEFVKFMTGPEGQKISAIYGGLAPTIPALFEDKEVLEANPFFGEKGFVEGLNAAVPRPVVPNYPEVSEIIQINVSKAIAGEITVEEAVANMEKEIKAVLK